MLLRTCLPLVAVAAISTTAFTAAAPAWAADVRIKIGNEKGRKVFLVCDGEDSMFYTPFVRAKPYLKVVKEGTYGCMCFEYGEVRNLGTARQSEPFAQFAFPLAQRRSPGSALAAEHGCQVGCPDVWRVCHWFRSDCWVRFTSSGITDIVR